MVLMVKWWAECGIVGPIEGGAYKAAAEIVQTLQLCVRKLSLYSVKTRLRTENGRDWSEAEVAVG
jgi:hypothetical protein